MVGSYRLEDPSGSFPQLPSAWYHGLVDGVLTRHHWHERRRTDTFDRSGHTVHKVFLRRSDSNASGDSLNRFENASVHSAHLNRLCGCSQT
jgi:putative heme degradation protein